MAVTTLSDINKTMTEQVKEQKDTNEAIGALVSKISAQMENAEKQKLRSFNKKPIAKTRAKKDLAKDFKSGVVQGLGLDGIAGMFDRLLPGLGLGTLLGASGKIFGKTILAGIVGAAFATLAPEFSEAGGEWLMAGMKFVGMPTDWYDKLPQKEKDALETALGAAGLGLMTTIFLPSMTKWLLKGMWRLAVVPLGAAIWKGLTKFDVPPAVLDDAAQGAAQAAKSGTKAAAAAMEAAKSAGGTADEIAAAGAKALTEAAAEMPKVAPSGAKGAQAAMKAVEKAGGTADEIAAAGAKALGDSAPALPNRNFFVEGGKYFSKADGNLLSGAAADLAKRTHLQDIGAGQFARAAQNATSPGGVKGLSSAVKALEQSGKATGKYGRVLSLAKGILKGVAKGIVPVAIAMDFIEPVMAIVNDEPPEVVQKELAGALGSLGGGTLGFIAGGALVSAIPGVGQTGLANLAGAILGAVGGSLAGEYTAEAIAAAILTGNKPQNIAEMNENAAMSMPLVQHGPGTVSAAVMNELRNAAPTPIAKLQAEGRKTSSSTVSRVAPKAQRTSSSAQNLVIIDAEIQEMKARIEDIKTQAGGSGSNVTMNSGNTNVSQSTSYLLPMGQSMDLIDGGLALGAR